MLIAVWIVNGLLALVLLAAGVMKLVRSRTALAAAGQGWAADVPEGGVKAIGAAEVLAGLGLVLPLATGALPAPWC
jgi:hypothetical protein